MANIDHRDPDDDNLQRKISRRTAISKENIQSSSWAYCLSLYGSTYRDDGGSNSPLPEGVGFARLLKSRDPEAEGGGTDKELDPGTVGPLFC